MGKIMKNNIIHIAIELLISVVSSDKTHDRHNIISKARRNKCLTMVSRKSRNRMVQLIMGMKMAPASMALFDHSQSHEL